MLVLDDQERHILTFQIRADATANSPETDQDHMFFEVSRR